MPVASTTLPTLTVARLVAAHVNQLWQAWANDAEHPGCCYLCCASCTALKDLYDRGELDALYGVYVHHVGGSWEGWDSARRQVRRDWLCRGVVGDPDVLPRNPSVGPQSVAEREIGELQPVSSKDWVGLGQRVVSRRVELGYTTREAFAQVAGISSRLLGDLENGKRESYDTSTYAKLHQTLRWPIGSIPAILAGAKPFEEVDESKRRESPAYNGLRQLQEEARGAFRDAAVKALLADLTIEDLGFELQALAATLRRAVGLGGGGTLESSNRKIGD
ncbi:hypothetical protein AB0F72_08895 [Actinoplanes sp. NPDC023936]|uniref:hypothetical protein n=1 Tax=Actinoplanes sp. NPDC023936 TaxID=3154910 RepID=UPI00340C15E3